jgi:hypothetical protein
MFLCELTQQHVIGEEFVVVDGAPWLHTGLCEFDMHFSHEISATATPSNVSTKQ